RRAGFLPPARAGLSLRGWRRVRARPAPAGWAAPAGQGLPPPTADDSGGARPVALPGRRSSSPAGLPARPCLRPRDDVRGRGPGRAHRPGWARAGVARRAPRGRPTRPRAAPGDAPCRDGRGRTRARPSAGGGSRSSRATRVRSRCTHKRFRTHGLVPIGNAVEPSPGSHEAASAAERRLHAVVDTLGLHVYSGETHPDDRFVTLVALTPSRSLLGVDSEGNGSGDERWLAAIHPDDRVRYD